MTNRNFEKIRRQRLPSDDAFPGAGRRDLPHDRLFKFVKRSRFALPTDKAELRRIANQVAAEIAAKKGQ